MPKINKIKRSDYDRILITETLPYETPIIFSNDGLYDKVSTSGQATGIHRQILEALVFDSGFSKRTACTVPYVYKVRKNSMEFRRLALLHPMSQWRVRDFYRQYESLILHYCSISPASIRAPKRVAGSFYSKGSWENVNQYKTGSVGLASLDGYAKHAPSYFAYRGYDRLYKFFNSSDYVRLEKRFSVLLSLDVSKCFDSIYTHSLAWAVKDKEFVKENLNVGSFGDDFDAVIRHGNHNETNGIPIGPEVSRIFAEIIFQEIDRQVISKLDKLKFDGDYAFRRYVDDVFIFAKDDDAARAIYNCYADTLVAFNLHANSGKSIKLERPFLTKKSRLIYDASRFANDFFEKFLLGEGTGSLTPRKVYSPWRLTKNYIDSIKALCSHNEVDYDEIASFSISSITERIKRLVNNDLTNSSDEDKVNFLHALEIFVDLLFFLYSVAPSVGASYKLSTSIILTARFVKKYLPEDADSLYHRIFELTNSLLVDQSGRLHGEGVDGFIHLECLNVLLATRELGDGYLIPEAIIDRLFIYGQDLTYFTITSCLFYIKDDARYSRIRKAILAAVKAKLSDLSDVCRVSEKAYLLLDMLSCPFVPDKSKNNWISAVYSILGKPVPPAADIAGFIQSAKLESWQVNWADVDLLNSLEKKELKQAY